VTGITKKRRLARLRVNSGWALVAQPLLAVRGCDRRQVAKYVRAAYKTAQPGVAVLLEASLAGRRLRLVHDVFLKLLHFGIGAERFAHGRGRQFVHFGR
jgi:hypothetical protein